MSSKSKKDQKISKNIARGVDRYLLDPGSHIKTAELLRLANLNTSDLGDFNPQVVSEILKESGSESFKESGYGLYRINKAGIIFCLAGKNPTKAPRHLKAMSPRVLSVEKDWAQISQFFKGWQRGLWQFFRSYYWNFQLTPNKGKRKMEKPVPLTFPKGFQKPVIEFGRHYNSQGLRLAEQDDYYFDIINGFVHLYHYNYDFLHDRLRMCLKEDCNRFFFAEHQSRKYCPDRNCSKIVKSKRDTKLNREKRVAEPENYS